MFWHAVLRVAFSKCISEWFVRLMSELQEVHLGIWDTTLEIVMTYLTAVGDRNQLYTSSEVVPPLFISARVLGSLMKSLDLPSGTIHSLQEINSLTSVKFGEKIEGSATVSGSRRRGPVIFTTVDYKVATLHGEIIQTGKTTVLQPLEIEEQDQ